MSGVWTSLWSSLCSLRESESLSIKHNFYPPFSQETTLFQVAEEGPYHYSLLLLLLLHYGSYGRSAQAPRCGIVATDVRADQSLQRERARGRHGRCCSFGRQGRTVGLEDGADRETRGGQPESPERENGSPARVEGVDLPDGIEGFTQLENSQKGQGGR